MPWLQTYCSAMHCGGSVCSGVRGRQVSENHMIIVIYIIYSYNYSDSYRVL